MTLFHHENDKIRKVIAYSFWNYQYLKRRDDYIPIAPPYDPSPIDLCDDIINSKSISLEESGFGKIFQSFGFTCATILPDEEYITIKFKKSIDEELLIKEIHAILTVFRYDQTEVIADAYYDMAVANMKYDVDISIAHDRPAPRAVGLWLWDYCNNNGGFERKGIKTAAVRQLKNDFGTERLARLGYAASSERTLVRLLDRTIECISKFKVLSFS